VAGVKTYWYLTRGSGAVALVLLSVAVVIGIASIGRVRSGRWPRFAVEGLHRTSSLLAVVFVAIHVVTAVLDSFASISLLDAFVPFAGSYRPIWLGLGAVASDLLLAVIVTSLLRRRLGHRLWRSVHWLAYISWPIAVVHTLGTGSDVQLLWLQIVYGVCTAAVVAAVLARIAIGWPGRPRLRLGALGVLAALVLGLAVWLPLGPLGHDWAKRAGTPATLLPVSERGSAA
jgi:methionine sulfoxide reductase heme-binding subunit